MQIFLFCSCYVSVAVLDKKIYAMGGFEGHNRQRSAERYDPTTNQWSLIEPMTQQRSDASATTLDGIGSQNISKYPSASLYAGQ